MYCAFVFYRRVWRCGLGPVHSETPLSHNRNFMYCSRTYALTLPPDLRACCLDVVVLFLQCARIVRVYCCKFDTKQHVGVDTNRLCMWLARERWCLSERERMFDVVMTYALLSPFHMLTRSLYHTPLFTGNDSTAPIPQFSFVISYLRMKNPRRAYTQHTTQQRVVFFMCFDGFSSVFGLMAR